MPPTDRPAAFSSAAVSGAANPGAALSGGLLPRRVASFIATPEATFREDLPRVLLLLAAAVCLTGLLLHPDVPGVLKWVRGSLSLPASSDLGYPAHVAAYIALGAAAAWLMRPRTPIGRGLLLAGLAAHGCLSETAQLAVTARSFDLLDMTCNVASAAVGAWLVLRSHPQPPA